MRAMLEGFIDMGCVSADARIVEINGPIGRMRRELRLWLLGEVIADDRSRGNAGHSGVVGRPDMDG